MRLIIFDCDGTLVDSQHNIIAKMGLAFDDFGLPPPDPRAIRGLIGLSLEETLRHLLPAAGEGDIEGLVAAYRRQFFAGREGEFSPEPLFPHAAWVLRELSELGYLLGVATGKSRRGLDAVLGGHGLRDIFVTRQTADTNPGKPDPSMLYQAMAEAGVDPCDTMMLGDTSFDMAMAVNAKVHPVGVAWGYHSSDDLNEAGAGVVLTDFRELVTLVGEQWPVS